MNSYKIKNHNNNIKNNNNNNYFYNKAASIYLGFDLIVIRLVHYNKDLFELKPQTMKQVQRAKVFKVFIASRIGGQWLG